jgi:hypothetical protein
MRAVTATATAATTATSTKVTTTKRARQERIFIHLLLSEIPTPAWQNIVMDSQNAQPGTSKVLRSTYTN